MDKKYTNRELEELSNVVDEDTFEEVYGRKLRERKPDTEEDKLRKNG